MPEENSAETVGFSLYRKPGKVCHVQIWHAHFSERKVSKSFMLPEPAAEELRELDRLRGTRWVNNSLVLSVVERAMGFPSSQTMSARYSGEAR